jgi:hypothetical protein
MLIRLEHSRYTIHTFILESEQRVSSYGTSLVSAQKIHWLHGTSHDKLVWCLQRRFIGYTG